MDIAFVSNVVYPFVTGGAQKRIHEIGTRLTERGHDVTIYGRHFWDGPPEIEYEGMTLRAVAPEAELYSGQRRSIPEAIDFSVRLIPNLKHHSSEHDLIIVSVFPYFPVISSELVSVLSGTPIATTWHEVWFDYWDSYLGRLAFFGKSVERFTAWLPQRAIAVSGVTATRLSELGIPRSEIEVVHNGIDINLINSISVSGSCKEHFDVLYAGRLIPDKRIDILLDAFDQVSEKHDATLGIIGDGPDAEILREHTKHLSVSDRVTFLGFLEEYEDVLEHMKRATVFASPSTREGFGITYAEAMAADCTVIGVNHPESAASEVIGDAGFLAEPTVESVASALNAALSDESPPGNPKKRAENFDWSIIADRAEKIYSEIVEES